MAHPTLKMITHPHTPGYIITVWGWFFLKYIVVTDIKHPIAHELIKINLTENPFYSIPITVNRMAQEGAYLNYVKTDQGWISENFTIIVNTNGKVYHHM